MAATPLTLLHVIISLIGIVSGAVVVFGFLTNRALPKWTAWFLITTVATSASGFVLPAHKLLPSHIVGIISLVILAVTIPALYRFRLEGRWRATYVIGAVLAWYLNVFVLVVQLFLKVPALHALAPEGKEPPFAIAQGTVFFICVVLGVLSVKRFHSVNSTTRANAIAA